MRNYHAENLNSNRIIGLDVVRGIAILLVLFRHGDHVNFIQQIGWIGVDLFFVLSGFLVSGLLFREYKKTGELRIKRFLIRRSLKIFPSFYFFTFSAIALYYIFLDVEVDWNKLVPDLLYVQNYLPGYHGHTWSLAVEEQFYIGFAVFIFAAFKLKWLNRPGLMVTVLSSMIVTVVLLRLNASWAETGFAQTHVRIDGILIGVLLSYGVCFMNLMEIIQKYALPILVISLLLVVPISIDPATSVSRMTVSFLLMNLGFAGIVVLASNTEFYAGWLNSKLLKIGVQIIAFIGIHSYSIYLWHPTIKYGLSFYLEATGFAIIAYFITSIAVGSAISLLLEQPILKLRNRIFK